MHGNGYGEHGAIAAGNDEPGEIHGNPSFHHAKCGIFGRSPCALPLIGGLGRRIVPGSITKEWSSEYHGPVMSGAGAGPVSCRT